MSMIASFIAVPAEQLDALIANPGLISSIIYPDEGCADTSARTDVDKAWQAIHYMLNGDAWEGEGPLFLTILGGTEIGEDVAGYGPARYLAPVQVKELAAALSAIDAAGFSARYDPLALDAAEIYPQLWVRDGDDGLAYVQHYYTQLSAFYREAAAQGQGVLVYFS